MTKAINGCTANNPNWLGCFNSNYIYGFIGAMILGIFKQI